VVAPGGFIELNQAIELTIRATLSRRRRISSPMLPSITIDADAGSGTESRNWLGVRAWFDIRTSSISPNTVQRMITMASTNDLSG